MAAKPLETTKPAAAQHGGPPKPKRTRLGFSASYSRSDIALFASGLVLSGFCAFFPWYVFLNQEQFGVKAVKLGNIPSSGSAIRNRTPATRTAEETVNEANLATDVDTLTTGTTPSRVEQEEQVEAAMQPFPAAPPPEFELVHVANGRAMIQDDKGLYVVQRGSLLPDNSRVARIEKREGDWILVTSTERVLEIAK